MLFPRRPVLRRYVEVIACELCGVPIYEEEKKSCQALNSRVCLGFWVCFCFESVV